MKGAVAKSNSDNATKHGQSAFTEQSHEKGFRVASPDDPLLPSSVLVDLYIRLRNELDGGEYCLDPDHKIRAAIVMPIFSAAEAIGPDIVAVEARVRSELTPQRLAA